VSLGRALSALGRSIGYLIIAAVILILTVIISCGKTLALAWPRVSG